MFGELPKLFGRDFAIAYFLPSAGFLAATYVIIVDFEIELALSTLSNESLPRLVIAFALAALFWAIILSVLNRGVIRLMEGYWPFKLGQLLNWSEKSGYRKLLKQEEESDRLRTQYAADDFPRKLQDERNRIKRKKADRFPDKEHLVLPTSFGNIFRAFEIYPRVVYGIDAIPGWYRLLAVIPEHYRTLMDAARARVDLWVNVSFLAALATVEFFIRAIWTKRTTGIWPDSMVFWFPFLTLTLAYITYRLAGGAASEWGHWVKAAFDLYLPELRQKLEFALPSTTAQEKTMWTGFNRVTIYRDAAALPEKTRTSADDQDKRPKDLTTAIILADVQVLKKTLEVLLQQNQR
jgi:hypothetical protein